MKPVLLIQAPVFSLSGYGFHARDIVMALYESTKYSISILPTGWGGTSTTDNISPDVLDALQFMCNMQKPKTDNFTFVHIGVPNEFRKIGKKNIGITAGLESTGIPDSWIGPSNDMDAIIVPSSFIKELFKASGIKVPIYVVGEGVDTDIFHPMDLIVAPLLPERFHFDTRFNFLSVGQWIPTPNGEDRKGMGKLIQLFCEAFSGREDVGLVLKTQTSNVSSPDCYFTQQRIESAKQGRKFPKIYLIHGDLTDLEMYSLYNHPNIKAFVSPTSGEGFGRPVAEAIACNLPILITGWSGHMDFVKKDLAAIFDFTISEVPRSAMSPNLFQPGMCWAYPNADDVKNKMRRCVNSYSIAKEKAIKLGEYFRSNFNKKITDAKLIDVFDIVTEAALKIIQPINDTIQL